MEIPIRMSLSELSRKGTFTDSSTAYRSSSLVAQKGSLDTGGCEQLIRRLVVENPYNGSQWENDKPDEGIRGFGEPW
ncbi:hypothetical protein TNCV_1242881 [Trichonephila clavipes]|nr:hypothetical protein TNCV_1242881 [Trichonephila clavipes]